MVGAGSVVQSTAVDGIRAAIGGNNSAIMNILKNNINYILN